jgi:hypothetical protein
MIHHHGTPITPVEVLYALRGRHFCVSHTAPSQLKHCLRIGQSVMGDNGAYSVETRGMVPDWPGYYRWLEPWLRHPHWAVVPDVIGGTAEDNLALAAQWPFRRDLSAMVWHLHEPLDHLALLADEWPRIAFGSSGEFWQSGTDRWNARIDESWDMLERTNRRPWIHMMRAAKEAAEGPWPFASCDSTNVARNHAGSRERARSDAARMATDIDARNPPLAGKPRSHAGQKEMFS